MSPLRHMARSIAENVLVNIPPRRRNGTRLILAYHNVVAKRASTRGDRSLHLALEDFERQLEIIQSEAAVVPLMELLEGEVTSFPRVAITFDDAYLGAIQHGVMRCASFGWPCTVFVSPSLLGTIPEWDIRAERGMWSPQERHAYLWQSRGLGLHESTTSENQDLAEVAVIASLEDLRRAAANPLVTLGNHTMRHANLGSLEKGEVETEIRECAQWLAGLEGVRTVPVVAYPYGCPPSVPEGNHFGVLVTGGWFERPDSTFHVPRWNIPAGVSLNGFRARLRGWLV